MTFDIQLTPWMYVIVLTLCVRVKHHAQNHSLVIRKTAIFTHRQLESVEAVLTVRALMTIRVIDPHGISGWRRAKTAKRTALHVRTWSPSVLLSEAWRAFASQIGQDVAFNPQYGRTNRLLLRNVCHTNYYLWSLHQPKEALLNHIVWGKFEDDVSMYLYYILPHHK